MILNYLSALNLWLLCVSALSDEDEWIKFKLAHGKYYGSDEEEASRFEIFQDNLRKIIDNHKQFERKEVPYRLDINKFADISEEEFRSSLKQSFGHSPLNFPRSKREVGAAETDCNTRTDAVPDVFDWREQGGVTGVKDERVYYDGYSWAFAVAAAIETQVYISTNSLVSISAQQLIDCVEVADSNTTYWGGKLDFVYQYAFDNDIMTDDYYPYTGFVGECQKNQSGIRLELLTNMFKECAIKQPVALDGPVTATIDASKLANYAGGIVDGSLCSNAEEDQNHSVLIVGYGKDPDFGEYWLVKNSWGANWGEEGYLRIARLKDNTCGIGISPSCPYILQDVNGRSGENDVKNN